MEIALTLTRTEAALIHRLLIAEKEAAAASAANLDTAHRALVKADVDVAARLAVMTDKITAGDRAAAALGAARTISGAAFVARVNLI